MTALSTLCINPFLSGNWVQSQTSPRLRKSRGSVTDLRETSAGSDFMKTLTDLGFGWKLDWFVRLGSSQKPLLKEILGIPAPPLSHQIKLDRISTKPWKMLTFGPHFPFIHNSYFCQIMMWTYLTTAGTAPEVPFQPEQLLQTLSSYWLADYRADQPRASTLFTFTSKSGSELWKGCGWAHDQRKMYHFYEGGKLGGWLVKNKLIEGTGWHGCY